MNAFLDLAERQIPNPVKARARAAERRAQTAQAKALEKQLEEQKQLLTRREQKERHEALLAGPYADAAHELFVLLDRLTFADSGRLIELVRSGPWTGADADTRHTVLSACDWAIIRVRERAGLAPFDDPLPGAPDNAFLVLRTMLARGRE
jgi:hypothetical protein